MAQWRELQVKRVLEQDVQKLFDGWKARPDGQLFGVPDWLAEIRVEPIPCDQRRRGSFGYDFIPDIEFIVGRQRYVIELKHGAKSEPVALAEVLHHAAWFKRYDSGTASQVVPVVISQYNAWLRLAIDEYLRAVVRYVETVVLESPDRASLFAFDAPLAPWEVQPPEPWLMKLDPRAANLHWHRVAENGSWFGLAREMPSRPTILEEPYVWVVRSGADQQVLLWEGWAAKRGDKGLPTSTARDLDTNGRYFLATSDRRSATEAPTWLAGTTP